MIKWVQEGISPVDEAPEVPAEYWNGLQQITSRRITLAGYRMADIIITAEDRITALKKAMRPQ